VSINVDVQTLVLLPHDAIRFLRECPMYDRDDTVDLCPPRRPHAADETLVLGHGDSLPDLALPAVHPADEPVGLWHRFLNALLRAMAPWPV